MNNHNPAPSSSSSSPSSSPLSSSSSTSSVNTEFSSILSPSSSSPSSSSSSAICNPNGEQRKAFESFDLSEPNSNSFDALAEEVVKDNSDEIGRIAFWSVSSAKPGLDVDNLRDGNVMTFWQSDSEPPHHISIQFQRLTTVSVKKILTFIILFCYYLFILFNIYRVFPFSSTETLTTAIVHQRWRSTPEQSSLTFSTCAGILSRAMPLAG